MYKVADLIAVQLSEKDKIQIKNAKRMLKIHKECPEFLYGLMSTNRYSNSKLILEKFTKIIELEKVELYICPSCKGSRGKSVSTGHDCWGKSVSEYIRCTYCKGEGVVTKDYI